MGLYTTNDNPLSIPIVSDSHITVVRVYNLISLFIYYVLKWYQPLLEKYGDGSTKQKELKAEKIKSLYIPLPPLTEQYRIVAKIEELLPYIESYKQAETQIAALNSTFPELLKKSILQEAVMGKLVPQDPYDEPASVLLDRIRAEKQKLIKQGKIKPDKHESVIFKRDNSHYERIGNIERCIDDELPFEIPESWEWCRASYIGTMLRGKGIKRNETVKEGTPCVRYGEIYTTYNNSFTQTVSFIPAEIDSKCIHFGYRDILFTLTIKSRLIDYL